MARFPGGIRPGDPGRAAWQPAIPCRPAQASAKAQPAAPGLLFSAAPAMIGTSMVLLPLLLSPAVLQSLAVRRVACRPARRPD